MSSVHIKIGTGEKCWCSDCKKEYHREYSKKWEIKNRDKRLERQKTIAYRQNRKTWYETHNIRGRRENYLREWYQENKEEIRLRMNEWRSNNLDRWNSYGRKRRALLKSAKHLPYTLQEIFDRDSGICNLCLMPIDLKKKFPNRWSVTIDHVKPIFHGGDDTPDNVQIAHHGCNARKAHYV